MFDFFQHISKPDFQDYPKTDDVIILVKDNEQHKCFNIPTLIPHIRLLLAYMNSKRKIVSVGFWNLVAMATGGWIYPIATWLLWTVAS